MTVVKQGVCDIIEASCSRCGADVALLIDTLEDEATMREYKFGIFFGITFEVPLEVKKEDLQSQLDLDQTQVTLIETNPAINQYAIAVESTHQSQLIRQQGAQPFDFDQSLLYKSLFEMELAKQARLMIDQTGLAESIDGVSFKEEDFDWSWKQYFYPLDRQGGQ